jgi:hypothetical protein
MNTTRILYSEDGFGHRPNGNGGNGKEKKSVFLSSGIFCPICHLVVAIKDPYGKFVFDKEGVAIKGWHTHCVKETAVLQDKIQALAKQSSL